MVYWSQRGGARREPDAVNLGDMTPELGQHRRAEGWVLPSLRCRLSAPGRLWPAPVTASQSPGSATACLTVAPLGARSSGRKAAGGPLLVHHPLDSFVRSGPGGLPLAHGPTLRLSPAHTGRPSGYPAAAHSLNPAATAFSSRSAWTPWRWMRLGAGTGWASCRRT